MTDIDSWTGQIHAGDAIEVMNQMPEKSVDCVIFSPPYWGLRDYGEETENIWGGEDSCNHVWKAHKQNPRGGLNTDENPPDVGGNKHTQTTRLRGEGVETNFCQECGAWRGQFGLEPSPLMYVEHMVEVGKAVHRVLKDTGTWWLNLGDTYAGGGGISGVPDDWDSASTSNREKYPESVPAKDTEFPDKCKLLIPHRVAISLIDDGWICRNDVVWSKMNGMPESVTDRFTKSFEYFFLFSKQQNYYFDMDAVKQDGSQPRDVFETTVANFPDAHFATFPPDLIEDPTKASCPPKVCVNCQSPYERQTEVVNREIAGGVSRVPQEERGYDDRQGKSQNDREGLTQSTKKTVGWEKTCDCDTEETEPGVVLDPFMGSGTTAVVAENLGRRWVGIDLNKDYVEMSEDRISTETDFNVNPISEW